MYETDKLDTTERVAGWLHSLAISSARFDGDNIDEAKDLTEDPIILATPPRRIPLPQIVEEVSPTNTSFSIPTIFDSPVKQVTELPIPDLGTRDDSAASDATSVDDGEDHSCFEDVQHEERIGAQVECPEATTPTDIDDEEARLPANKLEPQSATPKIKHQDSESVTQTHSPPPYDASLPRLVRLTSCQQCIMLNLTCSRTPPYCSRCKRHGHAEMCLLQRRRLPEELSYLSARDYTVPVLLKLVGADEDIWRRKMELAEELREVWRQRMDMENWVLPDVCSRRGSWKGEVESGGRVGMGEGLGRVEYQELSVDMRYTGDI
ncbi:hypothetical protein IQ07DRAFT_599340 [Pyrenochaeta sp. DS3sAY3a]|nr:hypothetical protein IQ07DRAFT_599340 [Pyrenochaeta sp. DS3sAY3a]